MGKMATFCVENIVYKTKIKDSDTCQVLTYRVSQNYVNTNWLFFSCR